MKISKRFLAAFWSGIFLLCSACGVPPAETMGNEQTQVQTEAVSEEEETKETEGPEISLVMVGDVLLHEGVEECAHQEDGTYNYDPIFSNMKDQISDADLAIVNQEVIIGGEDLLITGYPSFNAPYEMGDALVNAGFDVVCHGTNHALDRGGKGIRHCLDFWEKKYPQIGVLGIHQSSEQQDRVYVYEKDGMKIAILNYTYGTNGLEMPSDMPYAVDMLDEDKVTADLKKARKLADFVVVCPHWGTEYELGISDEQKHWTDIFLENGVDLVIGTHPHVIEPIEVVRDPDTGRKMLVYYSLGNFVNWTGDSGEGIANRMVGGMAKVNIGLDENGHPKIMDYGVEALITHVVHRKNGVTVYPLLDYTDSLYEENELKEQDEEFSRTYCEGLCDRVWGDLWHKMYRMDE